MLHQEKESIIRFKEESYLDNKFVQIDENEAFKLISVTDHKGYPKEEENEIYQIVTGAIANQFRYYNSSNGGKKLELVFVQDPEGRLMNYDFITSTIIDTKKVNEMRMKIKTKNSIYHFERAQLPKENFFNDESNLIDLYLSNLSDKYIKGYYYSPNKNHYPLEKVLNLGMFTDTVLISLPEKSFQRKISYYLSSGNTIRFYDISLLHYYNFDLLIHNESKNEMILEFPNTVTWVIPAGVSKRGKLSEK